MKITPLSALRAMQRSLSCTVLASLPLHLLAQSAGTPREDADQTVELNPFVVTSAKDDAYTAKDTLAGNRARTDLTNVASSVTVVTKKFLEDTNSKKMDDLLVLTTNTEVAGQGGNFLGQGNGVVLTGQPGLTPVTRVRGLESADLTRGFFLTQIPFDSYNTGRVDIQRGPNSLLFGIGSPGGIINATPNEALFKNSNKIENQVASFGSTRFTADFNRELLPDELALRLSWLNDNTKYQQVPAFRNDHRLYGAMRWDPKMFNRGSAHTTFSINAEAGRISGRAPIETPPLDSITPYLTSPLFRDANGKLLTYTATTVGDAAVTNPWLTSSPAYASGFNYTAFEAGGSQGKSFYGSGFQWPDTSVSNTADPTAVTGGYFGITTYNIYANQAALLGSGIGAFKAKSLADASVFNFYDQLIGGPNSGESNKFHNLTFNLSQTFLNGKLGFNAAYNYETSEGSQYSFLSSYSTALTVDIMSTLADGTANPNVGRPMVVGGGQTGYGSWSKDVRDTFRLTGYGEFDFRDHLDRSGLLSRILGRHVITGLYDRYSDQLDARSYQTTIISSDPNNWQSLSPANASTSASEMALVYLGGPINNLTTPASLNLSRITGRVSFAPTTERLWNNVLKAWVTAPLNVMDNMSQPLDARLYASATLTKNIINSQVISWQGYLFDGTLVPLVGYRTDSENSYLRQADTRQGTPWVETQHGQYVLPNAPSSNASGHSATYSLVGHLPEQLRKKMPYGIEVSPFVNQSENFQPAAGRIDLNGNSLASPAGKTKEYGITISALDNKVSFKVTNFKTSVNNATVPGLSEPLGGAIISYAWGQSAYYAFTNPSLAIPFGFLHSNYGTTSGGQTLNFQPPGSGPYTQGQIDSEYAIQQASIAAWRANAQLSASIQKTFGMTNYQNPALYASGLSFPPNIVVTADTVSEGYEYELTANPAPGLLLALNASHVTATQTNIGSTFVAFMEQTNQLFNGPAGDMQIFASNGYTARSFFQATSLPQYKLLLATQGSSTAELRPWHFNGTVDYTIRTGKAKGAHFGGSLRWEDHIITGYPVIKVDGLETYDIGHPYKGPTNSAVDMWVGYQRRFGKNLTWRSQINVRNVFATRKLTVVTTEPDGSAAALKIPEPRVISWTNSLEF